MKKWNHLEAYIEIYINGEKKTFSVGGGFTKEDLDVDALSAKMCQPVIDYLFNPEVEVIR